MYNDTDKQDIMKIIMTTITKIKIIITIIITIILIVTIILIIITTTVIIIHTYIHIHTYLFVKHTQFNWTTKDAYASLREYPNVCKHNTKCVTKVNNKIVSYFVN